MQLNEILTRVFSGMLFENVSTKKKSNQKVCDLKYYVYICA